MLHYSDTRRAEKVYASTMGATFRCGTGLQPVRTALEVEQIEQAKLTYVQRALHGLQTSSVLNNFVFNLNTILTCAFSGSRVYLAA